MIAYSVCSSKKIDLVLFSSQMCAQVRFGTTSGSQWMLPLSELRNELLKREYYELSFRRERETLRKLST